MVKNCIYCYKKIGFLSEYHVNEDSSYTCEICFDKQKRIEEMEETVNEL